MTDGTPIPHELRNYAREAYYNLFADVARIWDIALDRVHYDNVTLYKPILWIRGRPIGNRSIVAVVESDSPCGELNDLTNVFTPGGFNNRKYNGLELTLKNKEYSDQVLDIARVMGGILKETVPVHTK